MVLRSCGVTRIFVGVEKGKERKKTARASCPFDYACEGEREGEDKPRERTEFAATRFRG